jgi:hypothetical protein
MNVRSCGVLLEAVGCGGIIVAGVSVLYDTAKYAPGSSVLGSPAFWIILGRYTVFAVAWLTLFAWAAAQFSTHQNDT